MGAPVVIGPMSNGMGCPPAFRRERGWFENLLLRFGRTSAPWLNTLMPGKQRAARRLLVHSRTHNALPPGVCTQVERLVENGVDLHLWRPHTGTGTGPESGVTPATARRFLVRTR